MLQNKNLYNKFLRFFHNELYNKVPHFISRFKNLYIQDQKIIDLGCGLGALSIYLSQQGAREVIGIDINQNKLNFANKNLSINFPNLENIQFDYIQINTIEDQSFNMIISKASFEHILNLKDLLLQLSTKLVPGGKIFAGFGPLYNSHWGDHNRLRHNIPWGHILFPNHLINRLNKKRRNKISSIHDLGLNGLSLKDYKQIFYNITSLKVLDFRTNVNEKRSMIIFRLIPKLPFLREYFTYNIYCTLQKNK